MTEITINNDVLINLLRIKHRDYTKAVGILNGLGIQHRRSQKVGCVSFKIKGRHVDGEGMVNLLTALDRQRIAHRVDYGSKGNFHLILTAVTVN